MELCNKKVAESNMLLSEALSFDSFILVSISGNLGHSQDGIHFNIKTLFFH